MRVVEDVNVYEGVPVCDCVPVYVYEGVPDCDCVPVAVYVYEGVPVCDRVILGVAGATVPLTDAASLPTVMSIPHAWGKVSVAE